MRHLLIFYILGFYFSVLSKAASTSPEGLESSPPSSLTYAAALKCIGFLSDEGKVTNERLFRSRPSSNEAVDMWLRGLDRGEVRHACCLSSSVGRASRLECMRRGLESHLSAAFYLEKVVSGIVFSLFLSIRVFV